MASTRRYAGRTGADRVEERRARLVRAAVDVLAEKGEAGATMTAICRQARLTERYFYESFPNRDAALVAALDHVADRIVEAVVAGFTGSGSPDDRLRAGIRAFVALVRRDPAAGAVAAVHSTASAPLRERRHQLVARFADLAAEYASALYGERAWPAEFGRVHGIVFIAGFAELVGAWLTGELELAEDELVDTAVRLFHGTALRPPG